MLTALNGYGQSTFNKYFPYNENSKANGVIVNKDSTYTLLSQFSNSVTGAPGLVLTKFDKTGTVLIQKDYLSNTPESYYIFLKNKLWCRINDHSFLILAACSNTNNTTGILVTKIDALTLDTNWVRYYSEPSFDLPMTQIVKLKDNRYWLMGNKFDNNNPSYLTRPVIFETDTLGNITFRKEINTLQGYNLDAATYDSLQPQLYIAGVNYNSSPQSYVCSADTSGNIIWNQQIGSSPYIPYFYQIEKKNNYLILSGLRWSSYSGGNNEYKLSLIKLNASNGTSTWQKTYGPAGAYNYLKGFTINSDESITATGNFQVPTSTVSNWNGIIFKANANGDGLWLKSYSTFTGNIEEGFLDIQPTLDKGYIMCGMPFFSPSDQSWVVKTDSLGNAPGVTTVTFTTDSFTSVNVGEREVVSLFAKMYPNPVNNQLYVELNNSLQSGIVGTAIYNSLGQALREEELQLIDGKASVKTSDLPNGIYFIQIQSKNAEPVRKQFIISR